MRLRSLTLSNVRKFAGKRAEITGIGDGITVVSEANEFGKSTFFDALHALFFEKYSSAAKPVKSLQPYAKGAVEIAAEIETDEGIFRVEKSFLQRKSARILRLPSGALIAQDDEAERWIATALGSDKNGPAGLLWVRQGAIGLDADTKDETAKQLETRRDLLSSVSGEIDAMTGGRRMDRVMKRVAEELKPLVTGTGRPTGPWRALQSEITEMEGELTTLDAQIDKLSQALSDRKQAEETLAQLDRPEARAHRVASLAKAETALAKAKAHAGQVERAAQDHRLAQIEADAARKALDDFLGAIDRVARAEKTAADAADARANAQENAQRQEAAVRAAQEAKTTTATAVTHARAMQEAARKQVQARAAKIRAKALSEQMQQIEKAQKSRDAARAKVAASMATENWLTQLEAAHAAAATQAAAVSAQAVTVHFDYSSDARASRDGAPLPGDERVALTRSTQIDLPGIGAMHVQVPESGQEAVLTLKHLQARLDQMLADAAVSSIRQARERAAEHAKWVQEAATADTILRTLAPNGTDPLRAEISAAELAAKDADDAPLTDQDTLDQALAQAQTDDDAAQVAMTRAEANFATAREGAIRAQADHQNAQTALEAALAAAGDGEARDLQRAELIRVDAQRVQALESKAEALKTLRAGAPDLATAQAEFTRAQNAVQAARDQVQKLQVRVASLSAEIHALSESGIEETRDTLAGQLEAARDQEARIAGKVAALTRLKEALEAERTAARDTYFGPVQAELAPLLSIVYDEAGLQFDTDNLLPAGLTRAETEERLDNLSGGTQEQIAILTRLAFARLFQGQGRHMPIVLDDALVYSDDARIVKMFTALTRVAQDQQILVFTCRTMAFMELGGTRPEVAISAV
ncbi:AAA family ATPase [Gymnodinialimonas sp. 57CJ19]|uniref:AAA family ATPase n=1 Tax=Gymnodinialimonas sp. 57CJ19 TaxID=3138498 RepID=UPI0031342C6A